MNYKLNEQNGKVSYLMISGNDVVLCHTDVEAAKWMCEQRAPKKETSPGHPAFCVHAGQYYFEGKWTKPKKRIKDVVCE